MTYRSPNLLLGWLNKESYNETSSLAAEPNDYIAKGTLTQARKLINSGQCLAILLPYYFQQC